MKRRAFLAALGGAVAWPLAASAQQGERVRRIGVLVPLPPPVFAPFFSELRQHGLIEGQNLSVDRRGFDAPYDRLSGMASEFVRAAPDAILCAGDAAIRAAQAATTKIPIVAITDDIVGAGLVRSLANPGSNTTGVSILAGDLDSKRQDVLMEFFPAIRRLAALSDVQNNTPAQLEALLDSARARGVELAIHRVGRSGDVAQAIKAARDGGAEALNVLASPLLHASRRDIFLHSGELRLPAIYQWPETAQEGGLLGYGPRFREVFRQLARLMIKVLSGENPANLPVEQPTKFDLVINLKTAKSLGLEIPPTLLARGDEVIE